VGSWCWLVLQVDGAWSRGEHQDQEEGGILEEGVERVQPRAAQPAPAGR